MTDLELTFNMLDMADPISMSELEARLRQLGEMGDKKRYVEAKELIQVSKASLQLVRDQVILGLKSRHTNVEVAKILEISVKTVEAAVRRSNQRPEA